MEAVRRLFRALAEDRTRLLILLSALGSALVAGTLPEVIKMIPGGNITLFAVLAVGTTVIAVVWFMFNARSGVGVAIFLQPTPSSNWSQTRILEESAEARRRHVGFFYVNVDELHENLLGDQRVHLTQRVIEARLKEAGSQASSSISFYLSCNLPSSFQLGQQTFRSTHGAQLRVSAFSQIRVHHVSSAAAPHSTLPPLKLRGTTLGPTATSQTYSIDSIMRRSAVDLNPAPSTGGNRHALIVNIANLPNMVHEASEAAGGRANGRYNISHNDVCRTAMIVECTANEFPNKDAAYNELLKYIAEKWEIYLMSNTTSPSLGPAEGRLFIAAPTALAFALGAVLPASTISVEHT